MTKPAKMGRSSKFSFPIPGRRHATTTTREDTQPVPAPSTPTITSNQYQSKAQRILGTTNDLNIDSPIREAAGDYSWRNIGSKSGGTSISIAESIHSAKDEPPSRNWDQESGVFPNGYGMQRQPSSMLLVPREGSVMSSNGLRHNDSSSTLRSHYDRLNSPLAISQQTSASSARDQALRKGPPQIHQRSPLLNVESPIERHDDNFRAKHINFTEDDAIIPDNVRKKPARLDLSKLFPRSRKHGEKNLASSTTSNDSRSPSSSSILSRNSSQPPTERNRLKKAPSKESLQSHNRFSVRTSRSHEPQISNKDGTLPDLYDYQNVPTRGPRMDRIPESGAPNHIGTKNRRESHVNMEGHGGSSNSSSWNCETATREPFSWKSVRAGIMVPSYDNSSAASISSRNTKTSKRTAPSIRSQVDLKDKSVLSLSSDSEDDMFDPEPSSRLSNHNTNPHQAQNRLSLRPADNRPLAGLPGGLAARQTRENIPVRKPKQNLLPVPEAVSDTLHISGPWPKPPTNTLHEPQERQYRGSILKEKRNSRQASIISSIGSHHEPTPPLTPSSLESSRVAPERESRFMAVTKQEEALLEALRQKRARMREEIIEEHLKTPSPPQAPNRSNSKYSTTSTSTGRSVSTFAGKQRERRPLFLDVGTGGVPNVDVPEPSPDLSDFLSFGSDATPRHSWAPSKESTGSSVQRVEPMGFASTSMRSGGGQGQGKKERKLRLSAVGVGDGLGERKRNASVVRFVEDGKGEGGHRQGEYEDDADGDEGGVIWGL